jgi:hypothetical protein
MPRSGSHGWLPILGLGLILIGCSRSAPPSFPEWAKKEPEYAPTPGSANAFDGYVQASRLATTNAADLVTFVSFDGRNKHKLIDRLRPALSLLRTAAGKRCDFHFVSRPPFQPDPNHAGWRLLRLALVWQIEAAVKNKNYDVAINLASLSSKVGFDLSGGGARDCDLGLQFVDDARRALLPALNDFDKNQLAGLTNGMKRALSALPAFDQVIGNERLQMLQSVQFVQDCYRKGDMAPLDDNLLNEVRDATTFLRQLKKDDRSKRPDYFEKFAREADLYCDWARRQSAVPAMKRPDPADKKTGMRLAGDRPWRRFSKQFFTTLQPIQDKLDACVARTRLLILTSELMRQARVSGVAPRNLDGFTRELTIDPYTGTSFRYHPVGMDFRLYSAGPNFEDDQGETDAIYTTPDLTLERL